MRKKDIPDSYYDQSAARWLDAVRPDWDQLPEAVRDTLRRQARAGFERLAAAPDHDGDTRETEPPTELFFLNDATGPSPEILVSQAITLKEILSRVPAPHGKAEAALSRHNAVDRMLLAALKQIAALPSPAATAEHLLGDYRELLEDAVDIIFTLSLDGHFLSVNQAVSRILGFEPEEIRGRFMGDFIDEETLAQSWRIIEEILTGKSVQMPYEQNVFHKDGTTITLEFTTRVVRHNGTVVGFQSIARDRTERRSLRLKLQQERDKLSGILQGIGAGLLIIDSDDNILWANEQIPQWFHIKESIEGRKCHEVLFGRGAPCDVCPHHESLRTGAVARKEVLSADMPGHTGNYFLFTSTPLRDKEGRITQTIEMIQDVTEAHIFHEKSHFWQEFFTKVVNNAPVGIFTLDPTGNVLSWNLYMEDTYGVIAQDIVGKNMFEEFPALRTEGFDLWMPEVIANKKPIVALDWRHASRNKGMRTIDLMLYPLLDEAGDLLGISFINHDLTERHRMLEELQQTRDFLGRLFDAVTDYVLVIGLDGKIYDVNRAVEKVFHYNAAQMLGREWSILFPRREAYNDFMNIVRKRESIDYMELELRDKEGETRHVIQSVSFISSVQGEPEAIALIGKDITEFKEMQEKMMRVQRLNALGEMASGVAHDFNNLLAVVLGRSQLMARQTTDPLLLKSLEVMARAARHGSEIIKRIQSFARQTTGKEGFQEFDLNDILSEAIEFTRTRWRNDTGHSIINLTFTPAPRCIILGNAHELLEVFTNMILNAVDAMPHGGDLIITTELREGCVVTSISDTGVGMPQEVRRRIFDPFFTTKAGKGTGLGLSVSYGIVEGHGGAIEVFSELGHGATFCIWLPAKDVAAITHPSTVSTAPHGPRILVVEDDTDVRDLIVEILASRQLDVTAAAHGREAVSLLETRHFDVLYTDLRMTSGVDGWDVIRSAQSRNPDIIVAMVTAWESSVKRDDLKKHHVHALIGKPFTQREILEVLVAAGVKTPDIDLLD